MYLDQTETKIVSEFKDLLIRHYRKKLKLITLFGSKAKGDFNEFSDIDILIVTKEKDTRLAREIIGIAFDLMLKYKKYISAKVIDQFQFQLLNLLKTPFMMNIQKESTKLWLAK